MRACMCVCACACTWRAGRRESPAGDVCSSNCTSLICVYLHDVRCLQPFRRWVSPRTRAAACRYQLFPPRPPGDARRSQVLRLPRPRKLASCAVCRSPRTDLSSRMMTTLLAYRLCSRKQVDFRKTLDFVGAFIKNKTKPIWFGAWSCGMGITRQGFESQLLCCVMERLGALQVMSGIYHFFLYA